MKVTAIFAILLIALCHVALGSSRRHAMGANNGERRMRAPASNDNNGLLFANRRNALHQDGLLANNNRNLAAPARHRRLAAGGNRRRLLAAPDAANPERRHQAAAAAPRKRLANRERRQRAQNANKRRVFLAQRKPRKEAHLAAPGLEDGSANSNVKQINKLAAHRQQRKAGAGALGSHSGRRPMEGYLADNAIDRAPRNKRA